MTSKNYDIILQKTECNKHLSHLPLSKQSLVFLVTEGSAESLDSTVVASVTLHRRPKVVVIATAVARE